jgi:hypothetical protein
MHFFRHTVGKVHQLGVTSYIIWQDTPRLAIDERNGLPILGMDRSVYIHSKTKPNHPKCYTYIPMLLKTAATHTVSDHQQEHIQKETSRGWERERERPLRDQRLHNATWKYALLNPSPQSPPLPLILMCTNISDNNASFKTKAFPWAEPPCTPTFPLSSGILITEQHHPQSKREYGKLDCYLSVKSSSWVATAANITAEMK